MEADEHVFERRITALALARTLAPGMTIRDTRAVTGDAKTIQASVSDVPLPHISVDVHKDAHGEPTPIRSPDLAIVATIGEGGMGRVHLARQRSLDRDVAVKTLKDGRRARRRRRICYVRRASPARSSIPASFRCMRSASTSAAGRSSS